MAQKSLNSWSWKSIHDVYAILGRQLKEYERVARAVGLKLPVLVKPGELIEMPMDKATFVARWYLDVNRINRQIQCLDKEIARRNKLVGVV